MYRTGIPRLQSPLRLAKTKAYFKVIDGVSCYFIDELCRQVTMTSENLEIDWRHMKMIPFKRGMIGVDNTLKVNYFFNIDKAERTTDVEIEELHPGVESQSTGYGLVNY